MKITAPTQWLDEVDVEALRTWFINERGFRENGRWLMSPNDESVSVLLPSNLKRFTDWKPRLLEAIEQAAEIQLITAAEWFERQRAAKST